jgi:hypothetical protein
LLTHHSRTVHMLCPAARVGDLPGSPQQVHRVGSMVLLDRPRRSGFRQGSIDRRGKKSAP